MCHTVRQSITLVDIRVTEEVGVATALEQRPVSSPARRSLWWIAAVVTSAVVLAGLRLALVDRPSEQPTLPTPQAVGFTPISPWTLESGLSPVVTLPRPLAGKAYRMMLGCSGSGSITIVETDSGGGFRSTRPCTGRYDRTDVFPMIQPNARGVAGPASPGPYWVELHLDGRVSAATAFAVSVDYGPSRSGAPTAAADAAAAD